MRRLVIAAGLVAIAAPGLAEPRSPAPAVPRSCLALAQRYGQTAPTVITPAQARLVLGMLALADQADPDVKACKTFLQKEANR